MCCDVFRCIDDRPDRQPTALPGVSDQLALLCVHPTPPPISSSYRLRAMDVDWCLSCGRHLNDSATYCSRECLSQDDPTAALALIPLEDSPSLSDDDQILFHE